MQELILSGLEIKITNALNNGIPIFVSEWGTSSADGMVVCLQMKQIGGLIIWLIKR